MAVDRISRWLSMEGKIRSDIKEDIIHSKPREKWLDEQAVSVYYLEFFYSQCIIP